MDSQASIGFGPGPWMCAFGCGVAIVPLVGTDGFCYWAEKASGARHYTNCEPWRMATLAGSITRANSWDIRP